MQHLTPKEAYAFLQANPQTAFIDARSEMEEQWPRQGDQPQIPRACQKAASTNRPFLLICRSGNRSQARKNLSSETK